MIVDSLIDHMRTKEGNMGFNREGKMRGKMRGVLPLQLSPMYPLYPLLVDGSWHSCGHSGGALRSWVRPMNDTWQLAPL